MQALLLRLVEVSCSARPFLWLDLCKRIITATAATVVPRAEEDPMAAVQVAQPKRSGGGGRSSGGGGSAAADALDEMNDVIGGADLEGEDLHDVGDDCTWVISVGSFD